MLMEPVTALVVVSEAVSNVKCRSSIDFIFLLSALLEVSIIDDLNLPTGDHCFFQMLKFTLSRSTLIS